MSQEQRQVTIVANHINKTARFETDAETFGDLKEEAQEETGQDLFDGNTRTIIREGRQELSMQDAELPSGGFTLIVVADKVKSGDAEIESSDTSADDDYEDWSYHQLRGECIHREFDTDVYNGPGATKKSIIETLREDDAKQEGQTANVEAEFEQMKEEINDVVSEAREKIQSIIEEYAQKLPVDVIPDYTETVEDIKQQLGL